MARITLSGIITDINGSVQGWTFQNSLIGKIVRSKPIQSRTNCNLRGSFQKVWGALPSIWFSLSSAEKDDWNTFAGANAFTDIYGNTKTLSGYQFFTSCIIRQIFQNTYSSPLAPVGVPAPDAMDAFTLNLTPTAIEMVFAAAFNHPDNTCWIFVTNPTNESATSNRKLYRQLPTLVPPNTSTVDITSLYDNRNNVPWTVQYSAFPITMHCYAFLCRNESGITSLPERASATT